MPNTSRDFLKAAAQLLTTAKHLLEGGSSSFTLHAMYLGGYTIECALKSLILEATPAADRSETLKKISAGVQMHDWQVLAGILNDLHRPIPAELKKRWRRSLKQSGWSTALRYETGRRNRGETRGFLNTAEEVYNWVKGELP